MSGLSGFYVGNTSLGEIDADNVKFTVDKSGKKTAIAIGLSTVATGIHSRSEGNHTSAIGPYSHAEGLYTYASGVFSHAEGSRTSAIGAYS